MIGSIRSSIVSIMIMIILFIPAPHQEKINIMYRKKEFIRLFTHIACIPVIFSRFASTPIVVPLRSCCIRGGRGSDSVRRVRSITTVVLIFGFAVAFFTIPGALVPVSSSVQRENVHKLASIPSNDRLSINLLPTCLFYDLRPEIQSFPLHPLLFFCHRHQY